MQITCCSWLWRDTWSSLFWWWETESGPQCYSIWVAFCFEPLHIILPGQSHTLLHKTCFQRSLHSIVFPEAPHNLTIFPPRLFSTPYKAFSKKIVVTITHRQIIRTEKRSSSCFPLALYPILSPEQSKLHFVQTSDSHKANSKALGMAIPPGKVWQLAELWWQWSKFTSSLVAIPRDDPTLVLLLIVAALMMIYF